jgi:hypothetical protein
MKLYFTVVTIDCIGLEKKTEVLHLNLWVLKPLLRPPSCAYANGAHLVVGSGMKPKTPLRGLPTGISNGTAIWAGITDVVYGFRKTDIGKGIERNTPEDFEPRTVHFFDSLIHFDCFSFVSRAHICTRVAWFAEMFFFLFPQSPFSCTQFVRTIAIVQATSSWLYTYTWRLENKNNDRQIRRLGVE